MKLVQFNGCHVVVGEGGPFQAVEDDDADLALGEGELLLSYWDDQGAVVLVGPEDEPGRFELMGRSRRRRATLRRKSLHCFEGQWFEGSASGSLRVELPEDAEFPETSVLH